MAEEPGVTDGRSSPESSYIDDDWVHSPTAGKRVRFLDRPDDPETDPLEFEM